MKNIRKTAVYTILAAFCIIMLPKDSHAGSVSEKASDKRNEILTYLRSIRPMVYNFPCEPFPQCAEKATTPEEVEKLTRVVMYQHIKRVYQQGLIYYFERNFINAYLRFLDCQTRTEELMEDISQSYLTRTEQMLRDSIEKKDRTAIKDADKRKEMEENEMSLVDISIEFGPDSKLRRDFLYNRQAPLETRRYRPHQVHYALNKYRIEKNAEKGYYHLGLAREARLKALSVDYNLTPRQKIEPHHRKMRIELYIQTVLLCRLAKYNAEYIFKLKYPYDNYTIDDLPGTYKEPKLGEVSEIKAEVPELENTKMNWLKNPYYLPKKLHPVFDLRLPEAYRRDSTDLRNWVYSDEVDMAIKFKFHKKPPTELKSSSDKGGGGTEPAKKDPNTK